jgi:hypothetical protein
VTRRDVSRLLRQYDQGHVTRHELLNGLVRAAALVSADEVAVALPLDVMEVLREETVSPPASFAAMPPIVRLRGWPGSGEEERNDRRLTFEGLWRRHRYFQCQPD